MKGGPATPKCGQGRVLSQLGHFQLAVAFAIVGVGSRGMLQYYGGG